ncbi:MAG: histidinol-phosphate transaminase, partial [Lachnospiraceae bacterium]|nr:histidinol-phosphate transaminase [Lachnospiraceae bacterium]
MSTWEEKVHKVSPYTPGEQPKNADVIKLNTNENPYPPAPAVQKAIADFDYDTLRKYPDPAATGLIEALSDTYGVPADQIFVGVGSDDVLAMSFLTFFTSGEKILFPDVTYSFYDVWADEFRIPFDTVPLREDFSIDIDGFCSGKAGGIVIPNPNAPTGLDAGVDALEKIIRSNPQCVVIIDEAYVDFGAKSVLPLIEKYDNLLVTQTFSKSRALAG